MQAVYAVSREQLDRWGAELGRRPDNGAFGENLTTAELEADRPLVVDHELSGAYLSIETPGPVRVGSGIAETLSRPPPSCHDASAQLVTLVVRDLNVSRRFYAEGMGWPPELDVPGEVTMIRVADKVMLSLWQESAAVAELGEVGRAEGDLTARGDRRLPVGGRLQPGSDRAVSPLTALGRLASTGRTHGEDAR